MPAGARVRGWSLPEGPWSFVNVRLDRDLDLVDPALRFGELDLAPCLAFQDAGLAATAAKLGALAAARPGPHGRLYAEALAATPRRVGRDVAAVPGALDAQRARPRAQGPADDGRHRAPPGFPATRQEAARRTRRQMADQFRPRWPKLAALMDASADDVLAYLTFPTQRRAKLRSANP